MILEEFDYDKDAILNPAHFMESQIVTKGLRGRMPKVGVSCFERKGFNRILELLDCKEIAVSKNANDDFRWGEDVDALMNSSRRVNLRQDYDGNSSSRQQGSSNSTSRSDIRLKNVGEIYAESLDALSKLNFYHFTFKDDKSKEPQVGVMAQDLQKVFPNSVKADRDGWLTIRWDEMFFAAINAIKELNAKISDIVLEITSLKTSYQEQQATIKSQAEIIETLQKEIANLNDRVEKLENSK